MTRSPDEWCQVLIAGGVRSATADKWAPIFAGVIQDGTFSAGDGEIDDFLGQVLHESQRLERLEESLSYRAERLIEVWPSRFPTIQHAMPYARNPQALAQRVYGGRLGNDNPGDAWRYRGSGPLQVTGRDNFAALQKITGIPLLDNPDLLRRPTAEALRVCIAWWEGNVPDAVMGDIRRVTKAVNGGLVGLDDRREITDDVRDALT